MTKDKVENAGTAKPGLANDVTNSTYYMSQGATFMLPDGYRCDRQPDWRLALFSVLLPLDSAPVTEWPEGWVGGRFRGVKKIQFAAKTENGYEKLMKDVSGQSVDDWNYTPRTFHSGANAHFRRPLKQSMGHLAVDGAVSKNEPVGT